MDDSSTKRRAKTAQPRVIGTAGGLAIVMGAMVGIGIFITPAQVASHLPTPSLYLLAWLFGGLIAFAGATVYAELGTRFPEAGGDFVFLREAFGADLSFAAGWLLFIGVFTGSVATMAVPIAQYQLPVLLEPFGTFSPNAVVASAGVIELTVARAVGIGIIGLLTVLNILGTRLSTNAQIVLTGIPVVVLSIGAIYIFATSSAAPVEAPPVEDPLTINFGRAVLAVYFAYAGWNAIAYVGGEMKQPSTTMPRSLLGGTVAITLLYILLAGAFVYALGIADLQQAMEAGTATAHAVGSDATAYVVTLLIASALIGSLNGTVLAGGRVAMAMARQDALPSSIGKLHSRFKTPTAALLLQGALAALFVLTGTFEILLELTSIAMLLMSALTVVALFQIRRRDGTEAPYQATFYPFLPAFFLVTSLLVIGASIYRALSPEYGYSVDSLYPLLGLMIFVLIWAAARLRRAFSSW